MTQTGTPAPETLSVPQRIRHWLTSGWTFNKFVALGTIIFVAILLIPFLIGLFFAITGDPIESAARMRYWRDLITIVLSIQLILIVVAVAIVIVQVARFVNLLRSEVKPIAEDAQQTLRTARATTEFVSKNTVAPIIQTKSFFAGLVAFLREIILLGRILKRQNKSEEAAPDDKTSA
jgi:predicted PurR-regulated permease PerM